MSSSDDPFTQVLDALWNALVAWPAFADLVRPGNRLELPEDAENPYKPTVNNADLPEVFIEPSGGAAALAFTSSNFQPVQNYVLYGATGKMSPRLYLKLKWAVICALAKANQETHPFGFKFVQSIAITDGSEVIDDQDANRNEAGWSGRITIQVTFNFNRDFIIAPN